MPRQALPGPSPIAGFDDWPRDEAHQRLRALHAASRRYRGSFSDGGHAFDAAMQQEAWDFLTETR